MSDTIVQVFEHEVFGSIRTLIDEHGDPWFVAKDVCVALKLNNVGQALTRLDDDEKMQVEPKLITNDVWHGRKPYIVSESGFYSLVLASRTKESSDLRFWVTHEVLPSIRKYGRYEIDKGTDIVRANVLSVEDELRMEQQTLEVIQYHVNRNKMLEQTIVEQRITMEEQERHIIDQAETIEVMEPKAKMYDLCMSADGTVSVTEAARYLIQYDKTLTRNRLYALLRADGMICKTSNAPTKRAIEQGLMVQMMTVRGNGKANDPYAHLTRKGIDWCLNRYCKEAAA